MSRNDFEAAIKQLQSLAGHSSEQFETLGRSILAMAESKEYERNAHFQGSAKQVAYKILDLIPDSLHTYSRDDQYLVAQIIANYAYDLLEHASQFVMVSPEDVPDLTEWPTDPGTS